MAVLHRSVGGATWERLVMVVLLRAGSLGRGMVVDLVELIGTVDDAVLDSRLVLRMDRMWLVGAHADVLEQVPGRRPWRFRRQAPWRRLRAPVMTDGHRRAEWVPIRHSGDTGTHELHGWVRYVRGRCHSRFEIAPNPWLR